MDFDWEKLEFYHYLALVGLGIVVLAVILYFVRGRKLVVPAIVTCGIGCLVGGIALGVIGMAAFGYDLKPAASSTSSNAPAPGGGGPGGPPGGMGMGGMGMGGGMGGMGMAAMGGAGRQQTPKRQLATLVEKLDLVANKPLTVELTDDQRQKVLEQLKGLKDMDELQEDEARKRLEAILAVLDKHKETLEAIGFRWPGSGGGRAGGAGGGGRGGFGGGGGVGPGFGGPPGGGGAPGGGLGGPGGGFGGGPEPANPFKQDRDAKALESLETRLGKQGK